ncbi:MAG: hypothetical protein KAJ16_08635 [Calditrichia bacterium]|nr:hypothetical protein [Calditrichia bacterium]
MRFLNIVILSARQNRLIGLAWQEGREKDSIIVKLSVETKNNFCQHKSFV